MLEILLKAFGYLNMPKIETNAKHFIAWKHYESSNFPLSIISFTSVNSTVFLGHIFFHRQYFFDAVIFVGNFTTRYFLMLCCYTFVRIYASRVRVVNGFCWSKILPVIGESFDRHCNAKITFGWIWSIEMFMRLIQSILTLHSKNIKNYIHKEILVFCGWIMTKR